MANAFFLIRLALAGIFGVAGWAKLTDRPGTRQAIRDFGLPESIASLLAWLLPLGEIAVALAVLPVQTAWWGALGALTLLVAFLGGIGASLARGRRPECHCFGQLHSEPVGPGTVARNLVLALLALAVVLAGSTRLGPSAVDWLGELAPGQLVGVVAAGLGLALLALAVRELRALRQQLLRLETVIPVSPPVGDPPTTPEPQVDARPSDSPAVGSVAPSFRLPDLEGNRRSLDDLLAEGKSLLLLFIDAQCGSCNALLPEVGRWQRDDDGLVVAAISRGAPELNRARAASTG